MEEEHNNKEVEERVVEYFIKVLEGSDTDTHKQGAQASLSYQNEDPTTKRKSAGSGEDKHKNQLRMLSEMGTLNTFKGRSLSGGLTAHDGNGGTKSRLVKRGSTEKLRRVTQSEHNLRTRAYIGDRDPLSAPPIKRPPSGKPSLPKLRLEGLLLRETQRERGLSVTEKDALWRTVSDGDGEKMLRLNPNCPLLLRSRSAPLLTTWVRSDNVATRVGNQRYKIGTKKRSSSLNDIRQTSPRKRGEPFQPVTSAAGFQVYQEVEKWETPREKEEAGCYRKYFAGKDHTNWIGNHKVLGPVAISVRKEKKTSSYIAFIQTKTTNKFLRIPVGNVRTSVFRAPIADQLLHALDPVLTPRGIKDLIKTKNLDEKVEKELLRLEELKEVRASHNQYKFGVLYCKGNQTEEQIYENVGGSKRYLDFLSILGDRIELQDWPHYSGGLDTTGRHGDGTHSIYTEWRGNGIMFHVATLLPYNHKHQQLERKKHVGNDTCTIVFNDGPGPFNPAVMVSQYNHIYLVVSVDAESSSKDTVRYGVAVVCKDGIPPWKPRLPQPPVFDHGINARDFILQKLVNGEHAAMKGKYFLSRLYNARAFVIQSLEEKLLQSDKKKLKKASKG